MAAVVRITCESSLATAAINVWHYRITNASPTTEVGEALVALDTFYTAIAGVLSNQTISIGTRCVTEDQNPNLLIFPTTQSAAGTGGAPGALALAAVLSISSNIVGGSHRGRKYLGPIDASALQSDGRTLTAGDRTTIIAAAANLLVPTASGSVLGVWSRKNSTFTTATGVTVGVIAGLQRRRMN